jgi:hypothetical protein
MRGLNYPITKYGNICAQKQLVNKPFLPLLPRLSAWMRGSLMRKLLVLVPLMMVFLGAFCCLVGPDGESIESALFGAGLGLGIATCMFPTSYYVGRARTGEIPKKAALIRLLIVAVLAIPMPDLFYFLVEICNSFFSPDTLFHGDSAMVVLIAPLIIFWLAIPLSLISALVVWRANPPVPDGSP